METTVEARLRSRLKLEERVAAFELLDIPIWIFDSERTQIVWGNREAVALWRAEDLESLRRRDFSQVSSAIRTRWQSIIAKITKGQTVHEQFTFYPKGAPVTIECALSLIELDDGRTAMLIRGQTDSRVEAELVRGIEAIRHTSALIALLDEKGAVLMQNPASTRAFGEQRSLVSWLEGDATAATLLATARSGQVFSGELPARTLAGERWFAVEARGTQDPATGAAAVLVQMLDTTEQRAMANALERQHHHIRMLSVPILSLGEHTLALPLVGALDRERSAMLADQLLPAIVAKRARTVLFDLTGLSEFDEESVELLSRILRAVQMLGARPIVTSIRPELSRAMVTMQVELTGVRILRDMRDALRLSDL